MSVGEVRLSALISSALANNQSDIVLLFMRTELFDVLDNRCYQRLWRQFSMPFERFDQAVFAEIFPCIVERFGHAIGIKYKGISGEELALCHAAFPVFEDAQYRGGGVEPFNGAVVPE